MHGPRSGDGLGLPHPHFAWLATLTLFAAMLFASPASAHIGDRFYVPPPDYCYAPTPTDDIYLSASVDDTDSCVDWGVSPTYEGPVYESEAEAAADDPPPPAAVATALPTWRNVYDWPNGHGYVGVHDATSSDALYGRAANLGGSHGVWLWPRGGDYPDGGYAEWTYTAPGTNRIQKAVLNFAYRNKLLAHHCITVGLRTGAGVVAQHEWCKPAQPPDSQRDVSVTLQDPASNPTSKVFFFRIRMDCKNNPGCTKNIPALDPLTTGGHARLKFVDFTIVDDDNPEVEPSVVQYEHEQYSTVTIGRDTEYPVDAGGTRRIWIDQEGAGTILTSNAPCDPAHHTPALDNRICPIGHSLANTMDTSAFPDGAYTFTGWSEDVAGNRSSQVWYLFIDRSPRDQGRSVVAFDTPMSAGDAMTFAQTNALTALKFVSTFRDPGGTDELITTGYLPERGVSPADVVADHAVAISSIFSDLPDAEDEFDYSGFYPGYAMVGRLVVRGTQRAMLAAASQPNVRSVIPLDHRGAPVVQRPARRGIRLATASCNQEPWWPRSGTVIAGESTNYPGRRFLRQSFRWTVESLGHLKCPDDTTYEAEAWFYNYDDRRYLKPDIDTWATNFPERGDAGPYVDTNFGDRGWRFWKLPDELGYHIGISDARLLRANKTYFTIVRAKPDNASWDWVKIQGQRGDRLPSECHQTWCIVADDTENLIDENPHKNFEFRAPGSKRWRH